MKNICVQYMSLLFHQMFLVQEHTAGWIFVNASSLVGILIGNRSRIFFHHEGHEDTRSFSTDETDVADDFKKYLLYLLHLLIICIYGFSCEIHEFCLSSCGFLLFVVKSDKQ